jgi:hypothetical protein
MGKVGQRPGSCDHVVAPLRGCGSPWLEAALEHRSKPASAAALMERAARRVVRGLRVLLARRRLTGSAVGSPRSIPSRSCVVPVGDTLTANDLYLHQQESRHNDASGKGHVPDDGRLCRIGEIRLPAGPVPAGRRRRLSVNPHQMAAIARPIRRASPPRPLPAAGPSLDDEVPF